MKVFSAESLIGTEREVHCPTSEVCTSLRMLLASDNMGFSFHKTTIYKGGVEHWHYKNHVEACYCIQGRGILTALASGEQFDIVPDVVYVLDQHDNHTFQAIEDVVLICVFNPPLAGTEVHDKEGSYAS